MNRRELFKLGAVAATAPTAGIAQGEHAGHAATDTVKTVEAAWKPALFDAHQNETVIALTELIIPATDTPGAEAAQVNRYMDLLLNDGPADQREHFLSGLAWLDGYTLKHHQKPFVRLTTAEQTATLEKLDGATDEDLRPGTRFFRQAKQMTSGIYYSTQIGFQELNKGGRVPASFGCSHSDHA
jgi:hypothetical protein